LVWSMNDLQVLLESMHHSVALSRYCFMFVFSMQFK
jgi:hypothetical protein